MTATRRVGGGRVLGRGARSRLIDPHLFLLFYTSMVYSQPDTLSHTAHYAEGVF